MLIIGSRIGTSEILRNTRAKAKGNVMLEREFRQKDHEKEASSIERPSLWEEKRRRGRRSPQKRADEKRRTVGRNAVDEAQLYKNKECSVHRPIIWQLAGGGGQLAARPGGTKGRLLALEFGVDAVAAIPSQSRVENESLAGLAQSRGIGSL